jgi:hypothetical protein
MNEALSDNESRTKEGKHRACREEKRKKEEASVAASSQRLLDDVRQNCVLSCGFFFFFWQLPLTRCGPHEAHRYKMPRRRSNEKKYIYDMAAVALNRK